MKLLCIPDTRASWSVKRQGIWAGPYFFLSGLLVWKTIIFCTGSYKCFHHFIFVKFECVRGLFFQNFSLGVIPLHTTCYLCFLAYLFQCRGSAWYRPDFSWPWIHWLWGLPWYTFRKFSNILNISIRTFLCRLVKHFFGTWATCW